MGKELKMIIGRWVIESKEKRINQTESGHALGLDVGTIN
jgi:hypothetical protein